jgi:hypothetical protein
MESSFLVTADELWKPHCILEVLGAGMGER